MAHRNPWAALVDTAEDVADEDAPTPAGASNITLHLGRSRSEKRAVSTVTTYTREEDTPAGLEIMRPLVWIDLEMTGLDANNDVILQVAVLITDGNLETVVEGPEIVVHHSEEVMSRMNQWCVEHHGPSGLTAAVAESSVTMREAELQVLEFVRQHVKPQEGIVAGSTVHVDVAFLKKDMPELAEYLHYRIVDVSSIVELASRWFPNAWKRAPKKSFAHTAMSDIRESLAELRYYKQTVFKPPPNPSSKKH